VSLKRYVAISFIWPVPDRSCEHVSSEQEKWRQAPDTSR
jgi:hypothetical protein